MPRATPAFRERAMETLDRLCRVQVMGSAWHAAESWFETGLSERAP